MFFPEMTLATDFVCILISLALNLAVATIATDETLPDLIVVEKALTNRPNEESVPQMKHQIAELLASDEWPQVVLAVSLLSPLLEHARVSMAGDAGFVLSVLHKSLAADHPLIQRAGLSVCNSFDETSSVYHGIIVDLLKLVVPLFRAMSMTSAATPIGLL
jgi:hypothetical protein